MVLKQEKSALKQMIMNQSSSSRENKWELSGSCYHSIKKKKKNKHSRNDEVFKEWLSKMYCVWSEGTEYTSVYKQNKDEFSSMFTQRSKMFISQSQNQQWATPHRGRAEFELGGKNTKQTNNNTRPTQEKTWGCLRTLIYMQRSERNMHWA